MTVTKKEISMLRAGVGGGIAAHGGWLVCCLVLGCNVPNENLQLGNKALQEKQYASAVGYFSEALAENPRLLAGYLGRAEAYEKQQEYSAAIADYEAVLAWQPEHRVANECLGFVYLEMGEGFKAREQFTQIQKTMAPAPYLLARARAELMCGDAQPAIQYLQQLLELEPQQAQAHYYLGIALANQGKLAEADAAFSRVIDLEPERASAYWRRAVVRDRLQQTKLATADRKRATELDPAHAFAETEMGKKMVESLKNREAGGDASSLQTLRN
jgi:tetratricopeptide (TPR) repeat protein